MMRELPLKDNLTILTTPTENNLCIFSKEKATSKIFEEDKIIHTFENELFEQKEIKIHEIMMYKNEWYLFFSMDDEEAIFINNSITVLGNGILNIVPSPSGVLVAYNEEGILSAENDWAHYGLVEFNIDLSKFNAVLPHHLTSTFIDLEAISTISANGDIFLIAYTDVETQIMIKCNLYSHLTEVKEIGCDATIFELRQFNDYICVFAEDSIYLFDKTMCCNKKIDISEKVGREICNVYSSKNNIIFETEEMYILATMGELLNSII